ncbi:MAG TPA: phosphoribosylaminoimidazolesuccinocarboxamide synthase [Thermoanaerobaculales bacterium]|nr:phosphoribosylaminoimidazolesuccinocarboxamide synthase [Thermoanaerobaculales bacterium]HPA81347.1 phosphoribosylaminoimidazolesuccinocarboxamide synthase [Thermoanaerobaculales bacterium]HQL29376.1 phosphoribosylaminoimidazolesuccinocarboxamide synthase [Thermoanaerobaculales bacterium]HQN96058.1 phosphoribosylaminoimidazolesuccinocarboxamide synthase [Thermoanaerobaculales bacterium]HQP44701.1 phosphoribosylaminoimidazolesuccinocarboxamide synthase [Thermoanaerobaculales bacterium]
MALLTTSIPGGQLVSRGKVRDIYAVDGDLLLVATDRISAFDCVLSPGVPGRGVILTQLSNFWFGRFGDVPNHLVATERSAFPQPFRGLAELDRRSVLVRRLDPIPVECVARGYLAGSGWQEYRERGSVCGIALPSGLRESERLPQPIFTPATKATEGHDQNIGFDSMVGIVGGRVAETLRDLTLRIYREAAAYALERGIIIADTKFEFGLDPDGRIVWMDEALTPDSSRFWPADSYEPGRGQPSYDKQYLRDWLERSGWNKQPPAPVLPAEVVAGTLERYREAYRRLTGSSIELAT